MAEDTPESPSPEQEPVKKTKSAPVAEAAAPDGKQLLKSILEDGNLQNNTTPE
jgi:hypothetical protein